MVLVYVSPMCICYHLSWSTSHIELSSNPTETFTCINVLGVVRICLTSKNMLAVVDFDAVPVSSFSPSCNTIMLNQV